MENAADIANKSAALGSMDAVKESDAFDELMGFIDRGDIQLDGKAARTNKTARRVPSAEAVQEPRNKGLTQHEVTPKAQNIPLHCSKLGNTPASEGPAWAKEPIAEPEVDPRPHPHKSEAFSKTRRSPSLCPLRAESLRPRALQDQQFRQPTTAVEQP